VGLVALAKLGVTEGRMAEGLLREWRLAETAVTA
jgi:hypothetical protein